MKYHHQTDGEWVQFERKPMPIACCDCGLVHTIRFRVVKGKLQLQAFRDARRTGQVRRHMKNQYKVTIPDRISENLKRLLRKPLR